MKPDSHLFAGEVQRARSLITYPQSLYSYQHRD